LIAISLDAFIGLIPGTDFTGGRGFNHSLGILRFFENLTTILKIYEGPFQPYLTGMAEKVLLSCLPDT
jgi:hypothetical protein